MSLSLISYHGDNREIVLRHNDAIVVRDPQTRQLVLRGASTNPALSECPTCHQSLHNPSRERHQPSSHVGSQSAPFISPEYFRMLHSAYGPDVKSEPPSSPIRRLVEPSSNGTHVSGSSLGEAEFLTSTPVLEAGHSIKREAFSPNYFRSFFVEEKELGRGGKGVVLLVRHELDRVSLGQFACKRVPVGDDHAWLEKVLIEVQLLQGLSHPNLVSYRHVWLEDVKLNRFGPSVPCAFILQQYCNSGDLLHFVVGPGSLPISTNAALKERARRRSRGDSESPNHLQRKLTFEEIYSFFRDITSGLAHLHTSNYIHRDLKPSNCLLHRDGNDLHCLISDFGEVQAENAVRKSTGFTGTISYCAPEVLKMDESGKYGSFTTKSDIFSLGMILYFMCFGRLPYKSAEIVQEEFEDADMLRAEISAWSGFHDERMQRPELPNQLYSFLTRLLSLDPADRPNANDILHAIRTEKSLENPSRSRTGANPSGLGIRRIRDMEAPFPRPAPTERHRIRPFAQMHDAQSSEDSLSPQSLSRSSSPSRQLDDEAKERLHEVKHHTPLLMPPPSTGLSSFHHQVVLCLHFLVAWAISCQPTIFPIARLVIFFLKISSVTKPCSPFAARERVWYPLVGIAAVELALGNKFRWSGLAVLAAMHILLLWFFSRWGGGICNRSSVEQDQWEGKAWPA